MPRPTHALGTTVVDIPELVGIKMTLPNQVLHPFVHPHSRLAAPSRLAALLCHTAVPHLLVTNRSVGSGAIFPSADCSLAQPSLPSHTVRAVVQKLHT
jgi:hypothetical protein